MAQPDVTIDMLQDDVLLEIFDFYRNLVIESDGMWNWQKLLHICRRWRYLVLASPRRLDLQIECDRRTPTRKVLDIWPPFPISIHSCPSSMEGTRGNHNIFAALQRCNRISRIDFRFITCTEVEQFAAAMDEPFPVLTDICIHMLIKGSTDMAELPGSFLGGSAPRLQSFVLEGVAFPALPNLVLSATHFDSLHLIDIPHAGYIPPEVMVTFLLPLHTLDRLVVGFTSPESRPLQTSPPPSTRALLPSLTHFQFSGASEYLVDFIARIDTPMLNGLQMTFFSDNIANISQLHKFIDRTDGLKPFIQAEVYFCSWEVQASFKSHANIGLNIACEALDAPLSSMIRLFEQFPSIPSGVEQLELNDGPWDELIFLVEQEWETDLADPLWQQLLSPFVSVKSLYVSQGLVPIIESVLEKLTGECVITALPSLDNLFLEGSESSGFIENFMESLVSKRQLSGHPIIVQRWERKSAFGSPSGGLQFCSCRHLILFLTVSLDSLNRNMYNDLHPITESGLLFIPTHETLHCHVYLLRISMGICTLLN